MELFETFLTGIIQAHAGPAGEGNREDQHVLMQNVCKLHSFWSRKWVGNKRSYDT